MSISRLVLPACVSQTGPAEKAAGHLGPALGIHSGAEVFQFVVISCHHGHMEYTPTIDAGLVLFR